MNDNKMTPGTARDRVWDSILLRMLGMFMVLPVLTTYGMALQGASEALIGRRSVSTARRRRCSRSFGLLSTVWP